MNEAHQILLSTPIDDSWDEFKEMAQTTLNEAISRIEPMIRERQEFEKQAAENARIAEAQRIAQAEIAEKQRIQQEALDAQQRAMDEQQAEINRKQQAIADEQNRIAREEQNKIDAEAHAKAVEQARIDAVNQAEAERVERKRQETLAREKAEALRPEIEKVTSWMNDSIIATAPIINDPDLAELVSKIIRATVLHRDQLKTKVAA